MSTADPGNAQPEAWAGPAITGATLNELRGQIEASAVAHRAELIEPTPPSLSPTATGRQAAEICAPTIVAEHADWKALGGASNGCVGDEDHGTGYHRGANFVPATDYSRRRDPNGSDGPFVNWNYACAGDFRHGGNAALRNLGRIVLAELMAGKWTNIGEFIGQPWADRPVMYWSRWEGVLREYTGSGHDTWFHLSWYRSRVDQNTHIWDNAVKIRDGVDMPINDADVDRMLARDAIKNPRQRADSATNPTTSWGFAVGDMWGQTLNAIDKLNALQTTVNNLATQVTNQGKTISALSQSLPTVVDETALANRLTEAVKVALPAVGGVTDPKILADAIELVLKRQYGDSGAAFLAAMRDPRMVGGDPADGE